MTKSVRRSPIPAEPQKRRSGFQPGNQLAVGGPGYSLEKRRQQRAVSKALADLCEEWDPAEGCTRIEKLARKAFRLAETSKFLPDILAVLKFIAERMEGKPVVPVLTARVSPPINVITSDMSPAEAAKAYYAMLGNDAED